MKAIILAGGRSTRLYPLTRYTPKCLLRVGHRTILDYQLDGFKKHGVTEVVIVVGCHKAKIIRHVKKQHPDLHVTFLENPIYRKTNAIYGLWIARNAFPLNESVLFCHADVLFEEALIPHLLNKRGKNDTILAYKKGPTDEEAGKIILDNDERVTRLGKKISLREATGEYMQIAKFDPLFTRTMLDLLKTRIENEHQVNLYTIDLYNDVVQSKDVNAFGMEIGTLKITEVDTEADLRQAEKLFAHTNKNT
ncbi:phosphocholine cytidylyltransferase family protein [Patescibacteria group bacterium]|nr:phosphocholine cytidylyltransferase family protein [Patescibacteria group bacterium]